MFVHVSRCLIYKVQTRLRFRIAPQVVMAGKEADLEQSSMVAELWHGRLCYELSEMEAQQTFPMSEEGRADMLAWLEAHI